MLKIQFTNAEVEDRGYGLEVNGQSLEDIISLALKTKVGNKSAGYGGSLKTFKSNSCDVTVIITPHPVEATIETNDEVFNSVDDLEEERVNEFEKKTTEADPEE